jgi:predicted nucleotidyltransferase
LLDLVFKPDGSTRGFDELVNSSELVSLENVEVHVISIEKWLELKAASNREKDSMHIDLFKESRGDGSKS